MNLEVNFYVIDEEIDFKEKQIKNNLKEIIQRIYDENFINNNYFNFHLTKGKKTEEVLQTESV
jgi:hypothetical protein